MKLRSWMESPRTRLDFTAGFIDGILTALTLTAGRLLRSEALSVGLAFRVAAATGLTTLFVFFVAHYAELRAEIAHAERELNLLSHGKLAEGALGRRATREALAGSLLAGFCGLTGAFAPLVLSYFLPAPAWTGVAVSIGLLGILGVLLARSFYGEGVLWSAILMLGGVLRTWIGMRLDIAG